MSQTAFIWPIHASEARGLKVAREIGFVEGTDFVREGRGDDAVFRFTSTEQAMQFNRALASEPDPGEA